MEISLLRLQKIIMPKMKTKDKGEQEMEQTIKDYKVFVELKEILKYIEDDIFEKIPKSIIEKINAVDSNGYSFKYDFSKKLNEQKIELKTKQILSSLYIEYCCDEQKKEELLEKCRKNDIEYAKSVEINWDERSAIKKKNDENSISNDISTELIVKKKGILSIIIDKIKRLFKG